MTIPNAPELLAVVKAMANFNGNRDRAGFAFALAADAQREMVKGGDAYRHEQDEMALLRAAADLCEWRPES